MIGRPQPAWKNPNILLILSLVFCCGALSGAVIYKLVSQRVSAKPPVASWKDSTKEQTLNHLKNELHLTPAQAEEIETALDDFSLYYQMLHAQIEEVMTTSRSRIDQVLTEEQRKKFSRIMTDLKDKQGR
jgi:Spy/CpxP family protein refolding chaperone